MPPVMTIRTRRLLMRPPEERDILAITRLANDPGIGANTTVPYPYHPVFAAQFVKKLRADRERGQKGDLGGFLLTLASNPKCVVGCAGMHGGAGRPPSLGYWVARAYRSRGFATEASRALISAVFAGPAIDRVDVSCRVTNLRSKRVIERLGFRFIKRGTGYSRMFGRRVPTLNFVLERKVWERRQQRQGGLRD